MIKHIWFDVAGTLVTYSDEFERVHNQLRYQTYADLVGKPLTKKLKKEFEEIYARYGSNSAVFRSLGCSSDFWQKRFNTLDKTQYYQPNEAVTQTLKKIKNNLPISIFTNLKLKEIKKTLKLVGIDPTWFSHIISGDEIKERKPALDGFYLMIKQSLLDPSEILYVGDRIKVDILPAKKLGIKTCLVWQESKKADCSCKRFDQIIKYLKKENEKTLFNF